MSGRIRGRRMRVGSSGRLEGEAVAGCGMDVPGRV